MKILANKEIKNLFLSVFLIFGLTFLLTESFLWLSYHRLSLPLLILFLLAGSAVWAVCLGYFKRQNQIMEQAVSQINAYLDGDRSARIECDNEGELYRLFHSVNSLAAVLNAHADNELREKEFLKDTISDISHQLKTPLAALNIYNGLLQDEDIDVSCVKEFADLSERELDRMETLVQNLLKIAKLDAGAIVFEKEKENVADMMQDLELHFAYRAKQEQKEIILSGADDISLFCDRDWLSEAIGNIVKNALDHTQKGDAVHIEWRALPSAVQIAVKDTGCGIHPEDLHHIFKRFYRSRFSKDTQGIGLGLPLAKAIIEAHGGVIEVESELGIGTSFIANMGAEMGATSSIFPADDAVRRFLRAQGREWDFVPLCADEGCTYDGEIEIDLSSLEPMMACPDQPDRVRPVREIEKVPVQQVFFGSCTNGSYQDIAKAATVLQGRHVNENVSCVCGVASRQIFKQLLRDGYIDMLLDAGVRLAEIACGACCGIGQAPPTNGVSVRTSNRNFKGRSGNPTAQLYLASPETAAATAVAGTFATVEEIMGSDVRRLAGIHEPEVYCIDDSMLLPPLPQEEAEKVEIVRGPNIKPLPLPDAPEDNLRCRVSLKGGDNITTDDITPASAELSSMRSNIPLMSQYCYHNYDPDFAARATEYGKSIIIGGVNYGQGSSREHAAINPMYLGVKAVIAKSIARIHKGNLINHGIVPLTFADASDYERIDLADELEIRDFPAQIQRGRVTVQNRTKGVSFDAVLDLSAEAKEVLLCGGQLRYLRKKLEA